MSGLASVCEVSLAQGGAASSAFPGLNQAAWALPRSRYQRYWTREERRAWEAETRRSWGKQEGRGLEHLATAQPDARRWLLVIPPGGSVHSVKTSNSGYLKLLPVFTGK